MKAPYFDCASRVAALEDALGELRAAVDAANLVDLRRTVERLRELLLNIGEQIDESLTSA